VPLKEDGTRHERSRLTVPARATTSTSPVVLATAAACSLSSDSWSSFLAQLGPGHPELCLGLLVRPDSRQGSAARSPSADKKLATSACSNLRMAACACLLCVVRFAGLTFRPLLGLVGLPSGLFVGLTASRSARSRAGSGRASCVCSLQQAGEARRRPSGAVRSGFGLTAAPRAVVPRLRVGD